MHKDAKLTDITRGYSRLAKRSPAAEAAVWGGGGALAGYHGGGALASIMLRSMLAGKSPQEKARVIQKLKDDGTFQLIKNIGGAAGGLLGSGYVLNKRMDTGHGVKGALQSILQPDYYGQHPGKLKALANRAQQKATSEKYDAQDENYRYSSGRGPRLFKEGFVLEDPFTQDTVPLRASLDTIQADPFLSMPQKEITSNLLASAENTETGLVSGKSIMRGAMQAGAGAATGFLFGKVTSSLLSLPQPLKTRLSTVGAIAGSIINTGIFKDMGNE